MHIANRSSDWCGNPLPCRKAATALCYEYIHIRVNIATFYRCHLRRLIDFYEKLYQDLKPADPVRERAFLLLEQDRLDSGQLAGLMSIQQKL